MLCYASNNSHLQLALNPGVRVSSASISMSLKRGSPLCINDVLTDDVLCLILGCVESTKDKEAFGLVCKRWLGLQSTETKITARAGLHMLRGMSDRFTRLVELDYSQFASHRIYPDVTDSDLAVIARGFPCLRSISLTVII